MKITLNMGYEQLITIINQLPNHEVEKLKGEIDKILRKKSIEDEGLENFLAEGPVMSDEKYKDFEAHRKSFNLWRVN